VLIRAVLDVSGLGDRFEVLHSAEGEASGKPDPAVHLTAARKLGVRPEWCLAVEDSPSGVRAAKAAGMLCVAVPDRPPPDGQFHGADFVLASLRDVGDSLWEALDGEPVRTAGP